VLIYKKRKKTNRGNRGRKGKGGKRKYIEKKEILNTLPPYP
jgi:hypothetical protein